ncbi:hypothetical protein [Hymenobacter latericus]|uniref:hypothetical protein n=1 Tax=Hymenobacter sp. YIM 151858-1 TaxID=2987688 RepID=UPI0022269F58|nr:hypothetical protein [Hymenobacter sp. YIM 151858-1]UYZ58416.1 hypothetical protein OIS50_15285 [Hymenobacter sp. YIM 151858-1]
MLTITRVGVVAAISILPSWAGAQVITDVGKATAARDSVVHTANTLRQELQSRTVSLVTKAPAIGKRRVVTRGYAQPERLVATATASVEGRTPKQVLLWKHVRRVRRNGATLDVFYGYQGKHPVLEETRHNGQLAFVRITRYKWTPYVSLPTVAKQGWLSGNGYVRWGTESYILPATATK